MVTCSSRPVSNFAMVSDAFLPASTSFGGSFGPVLRLNDRRNVCVSHTESIVAFEEQSELYGVAMPPHTELELTASSVNVAAKL